MKKVFLLVWIVVTLPVFATGDLEPVYRNHVDLPATIESFAYEFEGDTLVSGLPDGVRWFREESNSEHGRSLFMSWFDKEGRLSLYTGHRYDEIDWIFYFDHYEYDSHGRLVRHRTRHPESTEHYQYDTRGRMIVRETTFPAEPGSVYHFSYDDKGNLAEQSRLDRSDGVTYKTEYRYDEAGNLSGSAVSQIADGTATLRETNRYEYRDGLLISALGEHDYYGEAPYRNLLDYDEEGRLISRMIIQGKRVTDEERWGYDESGNQTLYANVNHGTNWGSEWFGRIEWDYDSHGRVIERRTYHESHEPGDGGFYLDEVEVREHAPGATRAITFESDRTTVTRDATRNFDEGRLVRKVVESDLGVVPGTTRTETRYTYDSESGVIRTIVQTDEQGEVVKTVEIRFGYERPAEQDRL